MSRTHLLAAAITGALALPAHAQSADTPVTDLAKVTVSASTSRLPD